MGTVGDEALDLFPPTDTKREREIVQCYHRKAAWINPSGGKLIFDRRQVWPDFRMVTVPCGKCPACRVNNASQWATRVVHECDYVSESCMVNLTYDNEHLPLGYNLSKKDLVDFIKRLRIDLQRKGRNIRAYFACGEYGHQKGRPHYHLLLLGWQPDDLILYKTSYSGCPIYVSEYLQRKWQKGFCPVGTCTNKSAGYVARYAKKVFPRGNNRVSEFLISSRNIKLSNGKEGALGAQWLLDNHNVLRHGYIGLPCLPNVKLRIPEYYFDLLERWFPAEYEQLKQYRLDFAMDDNYGVYHLDGQSYDGFDFVLTDNYNEAKLAYDLGLDGTQSTSEILHNYAKQLRHADKLQLEKIEKKLQRNLDKYKVI